MSEEGQDIYTAPSKKERKPDIAPYRPPKAKSSEEKLPERKSPSEKYSPRRKEKPSLSKSTGSLTTIYKPKTEPKITEKITTECQEFKNNNNELLKQLFNNVKNNTKTRLPLRFTDEEDPKHKKPTIIPYIYKWHRKLYSSVPKNIFFDRNLNVNIEHVVPRSILVEKYDNDVYFPSDPYQLYVVNKNVNSYRQSVKFGVVNEPTLEFDKYGKPVVANDMKGFAIKECQVINCDKPEKCNINRTKKEYIDQIKYHCTNLSTEIDVNKNNFMDDVNKNNFMYMNNSTTHYELCPRIDPKSRTAEKEFKICYNCDNTCTIEPINSEKGKIARSVLYIYSLYIYPNLTDEHKYFFTNRPADYHVSNSWQYFFNDKTMRMYDEWNRTYPPDKDEVIETLEIANLLGYLNPFVMYYDEKLNAYVFDKNLQNTLFPCDETKIPKENPKIDVKPPIIITVDVFEYPKIPDYVVNKNFASDKGDKIIILSSTNPKAVENPKEAPTVSKMFLKYQKYKHKYLELKNAMGLV